MKSCKICGKEITGFRACTNFRTCSPRCEMALYGLGKKKRAEAARRERTTAAERRAQHLRQAALMFKLACAKVGMHIVEEPGSDPHYKVTHMGAILNMMPIVSARYPKAKDAEVLVSLDGRHRRTQVEVRFNSQMRMTVRSRCKRVWGQRRDGESRGYKAWMLPGLCTCGPCSIARILRATCLHMREEVHSIAEGHDGHGDDADRARADGAGDGLP